MSQRRVVSVPLRLRRRVTKSSLSTSRPRNMVAEERSKQRSNSAQEKWIKTPSALTPTTPQPSINHGANEDPEPAELTNVTRTRRVNPDLEGFNISGFRPIRRRVIVGDNEQTPTTAKLAIPISQPFLEQRASPGHLRGPGLDQSQPISRLPFPTSATTDLNPQPHCQCSQANK